MPTLFVGCRSKHLGVVNSEPQGSLHFPIGERVDADAFDANTKLVYLSTETAKSSSPSRFPDKYSLAQELTTVKVRKQPATIPKQNASTSQHRKRRHAVLVYEQH